MRYYFLMLVLFSCNSVQAPARQERINPLPHDKLTEGVVVLKEGAEGHIKLYNPDATVWKDIDLSNDSTPVKGIDPYSMKLENTHLVFRSIAQDQRSYRVIADEDSGLLKDVPKADTNFIFESWEKNILHAFSVNFDKEKNPVKETPDTTSKNVSNTDAEDDIYLPVEIKGDWLKLKWGNIFDTRRAYAFGWVRWRSGDRLLIGINYSD